MTDRELLEAAAKSAGLDFNTQYFNADSGLLVWDAAAGKFESWDWNPLTDDGDEARLEAALGLGVIWFATYVVVGTISGYYDHNDSTAYKQAARRRAGVCAAASKADRA